jgi:hypothetical protein
MQNKDSCNNVTLVGRGLLFISSTISDIFLYPVVMGLICNHMNIMIV